MFYSCYKYVYSIIFFVKIPLEIMPHLIIFFI